MSFDYKSIDINFSNCYHNLDLISKQWCSLDDLMKLGQFGRNSALKVKREIKNKLTNQGYKIPNHLIPMKEVVDYLDINVCYLELRIKERR